MNKLLIISLVSLLLIGSFLVSGRIQDVEGVAYWKFDEGTGDIVFDMTVNNNDGTIQGATWTIDSISGYALEFDGVNDRVNVIKTPSVDLTSEVVLEAWVKRKSKNDGMIISKNGPYFLAIRDNRVEGGVYANSGNGNSWQHVRGTTRIGINEWHKLIMKYDGKQVRVYVDEVLDGSATKTGLMPVVSQQVWLGWGQPGHNQYFEGIIDELRISGK